MLDPDRLLAAALQLGEGFGLHRVGPEELDRQRSSRVDLRD
jgi:hypothetical protein